jgi:hypothetical protein
MLALLTIIAVMSHRSLCEVSRFKFAPLCVNRGKTLHNWIRGFRKTVWNGLIWIMLTYALYIISVRYKTELSAEHYTCIHK